MSAPPTPGPVPYRWTVPEFQRLREANLLPVPPRVELLDGEVVVMAGGERTHEDAVRRLVERLRGALPAQTVVRAGAYVALSQHTALRPDVLVLAPGGAPVGEECADPGDVLLLVEVEQGTAAYDREIRLPRYARAGVSEVWLIDPVEGRLQVCREPVGSGYRYLRVLSPGERVVGGARGDAVFEVGELLRGS